VLKGKRKSATVCPPVLYLLQTVAVLFPFLVWSFLSCRLCLSPFLPRLLLSTQLLLIFYVGWLIEDRRKGRKTQSFGRRPVHALVSSFTYHSIKDQVWMVVNRRPRAWTYSRDFANTALAAGWKTRGFPGKRPPAVGSKPCGRGFGRDVRRMAGKDIPGIHPSDVSPSNRRVSFSLSRRVSFLSLDVFS